MLTNKAESTESNDSYILVCMRIYRNVQTSNIPKIVWRRQGVDDAGGNHDGFTHANLISFDVGYANKTHEDLQSQL